MPNAIRVLDIARDAYLAYGRTIANVNATSEERVQAEARVQAARVLVASEFAPERRAQPFPQELIALVNPPEGEQRNRIKCDICFQTDRKASKKVS